MIVLFTFFTVTDPELTIDNFTFFKEPIGINDPEKEIIREAKIRGDRVSIFIILLYLYLIYIYF